MIPYDLCLIIWHLRTLLTNGSKRIDDAVAFILSGSNAASATIKTDRPVSGSSEREVISTVTLSPGKVVVDFISFFLHYNGGTNTARTSYKVYVSKNGGFGFGTVGI